jgi:hypothetical protein
MLRAVRRVAPIIVLFACLGMGACGSSKQDTVVVRVGGNTITAGTVDHWIRVESVTSHGGVDVTKPLPKGVLPVPPEYADCIAYLISQTQAGPKPTRDEARIKCSVEYKIFKETILGILINYYWDLGESVQKGVHISDAEITKELHEQFPHDGELQRYLKITHESLADDRLIVKSKLLRMKLVAHSAQGTHTAAERQQAIVKEVAEEAAKWTPRTSCKPGFVVSACKQYRGPQT